MANRYKIFEKYNFQVPRYTSYPPATQFRNAESLDQPVKWLRNVTGGVSLYIHIPFCARLCHYCGCNMRVVNKYEPVADYLETLRAEISQIRGYLSPDIKITHLHFGGGSPTILKPGDFSRLILDINEAFPFEADIEISVEADPRNLTEAKIAAYAQSGVSRISLGVQDFNEEVLCLINRPQPFHVTYRAIQLCHTYGIHNINFDLMYGLPGQTRDTIVRTIELAVDLKPSRISYFGYAHVPWVKKHMNLMPQDRLPASLDRYVLQQTGASLIEQHGYIPVGIDHFSLPDDTMSIALRQKTLHRNFQGYTTDAASNLVGLGASSISTFAEGYVQNHPDLRQYMLSVRDGNLPIRKILKFNEGDLVAAHVIEQLMCYLCIDLADVRHRYDLPASYFDSAKEHLRALEADGVISMTGDIIKICPEYRVLTRVVCDAFDAYSMRDSAVQRHAQAI